MYWGDFNVKIQRSFIQHGCNVWIIRYLDGHKSQVAKRVELEYVDVDEAMQMPESTLVVPPTLLKAFGHGLVEADQLPRDFMTNDRQIEAVRAHLEDMRKLAFQPLKSGYSSGNDS